MFKRVIQGLLGLGLALSLLTLASYLPNVVADQTVIGSGGLTQSFGGNPSIVLGGGQNITAPSGTITFTVGATSWTMTTSAFTAPSTGVYNASTSGGFRFPANAVNYDSPATAVARIKAGTAWILAFGNFALTESTPTTLVTIGIPANPSAHAGGLLHYVIQANDVSNSQVRSGSIRISAVNPAGTETCNISDLTGVADASITETEDENLPTITSGTLTYAITCDTAGTNSVAVQINAVSSLTQSTFVASGWLETVHGGSGPTAP